MPSILTFESIPPGEARAFIEQINSHTQHPERNEVIFVEGTGHVYTERGQMLAEIILTLVRKWI